MWLLACSGPGAFARIAANEAIAHHFAIITGVLALTSLRIGLHQSRMILPGICWFLMLLHPAWTISARQGDCGGQKAGGAILFALATLVIVIIQATRFLVEDRRRRKPPIADDLA
ncbi:hypothetical protein P12x_004663 [Tundrisphaera lichenicola]|uniref:hypothetical protein n=1 Tax=Tundrisphaera lichenicola TaxID=2029860 RepID=UPI003EB7BC5F